MNAAAGNDDIVIDARDLPPPEPMEKVLQVLGLKRPGQAVRLLIHRQPHPLYALLDQQHYQHLTRTLDDGNFEIVIRDPPGC